MSSATQTALEHQLRAKLVELATGTADPLEVRITRRLNVLLTFGGPSVRVIADLNEAGDIGNAKMIGTWGAETVARDIAPDHPACVALESYAEMATYAG